MSTLYPANGTSVQTAAPSNDGIFDTMVSELNYLSQALRDNFVPAQAPAPTMAAAPEAEDKNDNTPSFSPSFGPSRTRH